MKILFLTKSKKYTCRILEHLIKNHEVVGIVCKKRAVIEETQMEKMCLDHKIEIFENDEVYQKIENGSMPYADLAISNTYGRLIKKPLLDWVNGNCINFHGAVLPEYRGLFAYNHGLLNGEKEWGVTVHYVNEKFDEGNIIAVEKFNICPEKISVTELEEKTQKTAYELTVKILEKWEKEGPLLSQPQQTGGRYYSREDFEKEKKVVITDTAAMVKKKIHAFWCPPYEGAYIEIDGEHFQLLPVEEK